LKLKGEAAAVVVEAAPKLPNAGLAACCLKQNKL